MMMMMMKGSLLALTCLCSAHFAATVGGPQAICPNPTIQAVEGETVDLPCYLDPLDNVENYAVDWKRLDLNKVVYSYRHQQENHQAQMDQYRGRASLNHEDLSRGILTLQISSVQLSDSGPYRCFVSKLMTRCNTTLIVIRDQQNMTTSGDSSTMRPPLHGPNNPDGGNMKLIIAVVTPAVIFIILVLAICGTIQKCVGRLRGSSEQKAEQEKGFELLKPPTKDHMDPGGPAADNLGIKVQTVQ